MLSIFRMLIAFLASLGQQAPTPEAPAQPIIIEPAGPPVFCAPDRPYCK